jgi:hypothetical protein
MLHGTADACESLLLVAAAFGEGLLSFFAGGGAAFFLATLGGAALADLKTVFLRAFFFMLVNAAELV